MAWESPEYPQRYDIATAPENKYIELSRVFAIALLGLAALAAALAGAVYFAKSYKSSYPMVVILPKDDGVWRVMDDQKSGNMMQYVAQEFVAREFVRRWFSVSHLHAANEAFWRTCVLNKCGMVEENIQGELCCMTTSEIFAGFMNREVVAWRRMFDERRAQSIPVDSRTGEAIIYAAPLSAPEFTGSGTLWRLDFEVAEYSVQGGSRLVPAGRRPVVAFVRVSTNNNIYPRSMGQFVSEFRYFYKESE
ncbi:MAG: hypothetical protein FWD33_02505 [Alphaproteobacteria bacterium]|nr:hypothetical protein [Alphaproteobacteria bacterium]